MVAPLQDWGLIDKSNATALRNDIPRPGMFGGGKQFRHLNSTLDVMLDMKAAATEKQILIPGLPKLIETYLQTVAQGTHLREQGWWKRYRRKLRDWHGSADEFKERCQTVWQLAHQTSFLVHTHTDKSETIPGGSIRRRRSLDGLLQAEPQPHNSFDDPPMRSTPPDAGLVAQSSNKNCTNANTLQEETMRRIAEMSAAKTLEQFTFHGRMPGQWVPQPQTINHFHGYNVGPGGEYNKGAAVNKCPSPTEVKGNGTNDIDDTSDKDSFKMPDRTKIDLIGHYD